MESLDKHLKLITQLPSGLKHKVEPELIRKLTTVSPAPISKEHENILPLSPKNILVLTGSKGDGGSAAAISPDIFIKHKVNILTICLHCLKIIYHKDARFETGLPIN